MPRASALLACLLLSPAPLALAAAPPTVYESSTMTPENMDYDAINKTFRAHMGWVDDRQIHYYKFRMYTPDTYPEHVKSVDSAKIPIGQVYLPTVDGTLNGSVGLTPVLRYHMADGEDYSDFMEVWLVNVSRSGRILRSYQDVMTMGRPFSTGIVVNMPIVPTGSTLQDPSGNGSAPIKPLTLWYKGDQVQAFTFETTSADLAALWNPVTREGAAAAAGSGYEMTVATLRAGNDSIASIPIWHVNQYTHGVTPGVNSGGPSPMGMRNVIDLDRGEPGYSPLWQVWWVSQLPAGYSADMASNAAQLAETNGFSIVKTPMYVNCPDVGPHRSETVNAAKVAAFETAPRVPPNTTVTLQGSLVMQGGQNVTAMLGDATLTTVQTNMMGGYAFEISGDQLAEGANNVTAVAPDGTVLATWTLTGGEIPPPTPTPSPTGAAESRGTPLSPFVAIAALALAVLGARRRRS